MNPFNPFSLCGGRKAFLATALISLMVSASANPLKEEYPAPHFSLSLEDPHTVAPAKDLPEYSLGPEIQEAQLDDFRAGNLTLTNVEHKGALYGNSATQVSTGSNIISDGSFQHSAGLSTVIQNTGANVLIQSSTTVQVRFD